MIYSVHDPFAGGFHYFEAAPDVAINDDLPTPTYPDALRTKTGVAASLAARPLPAGAIHVGSGLLPVGLISNGIEGSWSGTQKKGIPSGLGAFDASPTSMILVGGIGLVLVAAIAYFAGRK